MTQPSLEEKINKIFRKALENFKREVNPITTLNEDYRVTRTVDSNIGLQDKNVKSPDTDDEVVETSPSPWPVRKRKSAGTDYESSDDMGDDEEIQYCGTYSRSLRPTLRKVPARKARIIEKCRQNVEGDRITFKYRSDEFAWVKTEDLTELEKEYAFLSEDKEDLEQRLLEELRSNRGDEIKMRLPSCLKCGRSPDGHTSANCPHLGRKYCYGCRKYVTGHLAATCPENPLVRANERRLSRGSTGITDLRATAGTVDLRLPFWKSKVININREKNGISPVKFFLKEESGSEFVWVRSDDLEELEFQYAFHAYDKKEIKLSEGLRSSSSEVRRKTLKRMIAKINVGAPTYNKAKRMKYDY